MAITRAGAELMEKRGGLWSSAGRLFNPLLTGGLISMGVASGDRSVGGSTGEILGGLGGWKAGSALAGKLFAGRGKPVKFLSDMGLGMAGSVPGSTLGQKLLKPLAPWRRPEKVLPQAGEMQNFTGNYHGQTG